MKLFPLDVLSAQKDASRLPLAYLVRADDVGTSIASDDVFRRVVRALADPHSSMQVRAELVASGQYPGLALAIASGRFTGLLEARDLERLKLDLGRQLNRLVAKIRESMALCRVRHDRLAPRAVPYFEEKMQYALDCARRVPMDAAALVEGGRVIDLLSDDIGDIEEKELAALAQELQTLGSDSDGRLVESAESALREGSIERARYFLRSIASGDVSFPVDIIPHRDPIVLASSAHEAIEWMKAGPAPDRPFGFAQLWGPAPGDSVGESLLAAIDRVLNASLDSLDQDFVHVVNAIEQSLGFDNHGDSTERDVLDDGRSISTKLRGLRIEGLYAFEDAAYDAGIRIEYKRPGLRRPAGGDVRDNDDNPPDERPDEISSDYPDDVVEDSGGPGDSERFYISLGDSPVAVGDRHRLRLGWRSLLSLVGDRHRRHNLLRLIGRQMPAADAFPDAAHRSSTLSPLVGRDHVVEEMVGVGGSVLWVGPRGCGKSATLARAESRARLAGRVVRRLRTSDDVELVAELLANPRIDSWFNPGSESGIFITADDVGELDSSTGIRAVVLLQHVRDLEDARISAACTADIQFVGEGLQGSWRWLSPLTFPESRSVLERLVDIAGGRADPRAIDQLAYFAGGHPRILHLLLRRLRSAQPSTDWAIDSKAVRELLSQQELRGVAREMIIGALDDMPRLVSAAFATVWLRPNKRDKMPGMTAEEVSAEIAAVTDLVPTFDKVESALSCLEAAYLVEYRNGWILNQGGLGALLVDAEIEPRIDSWLE